MVLQLLLKCITKSLKIIRIVIIKACGIIHLTSRVHALYNVITMLATSGLEAISGNSGREAVCVWPTRNQNHNANKIREGTNQLSKTPVRLPTETT